MIGCREKTIIRSFVDLSKKVRIKLYNFAYLQDVEFIVKYKCKKIHKEILI